MGYRKQLVIEEGHTKKDGNIWHTFSSTFLLPLVGVTEFDFGLHFINAYISLDKPYCIYAICDNINNVTDIVTDIRLKSKPTYISTEINQDEIIYKFNILSENYHIYDLFIEGKYSKFPENYKKELLDIYGHEVQRVNYEVTIKNILYPQDYKRKQIAKRLGLSDTEWTIIQEVWDIPDLNYEAYKPLEELKALKDGDGEKLVASGSEI